MERGGIDEDRRGKERVKGGPVEESRVGGMGRKEEG